MSKQSRPYRLMTLLESLSKEEFYDLGKYLRRHSTSANDKLRLYAYLRKNWLEVDEEKRPDITNKLLQKRIYKKKLSNKGNINTLNSQLVKTIKDFLIEETLEKDTTTRNLLLSKIFKKRGLDSFFQKHSKRSKEKIEESETTFEAADYDALYMLTYDVTFHRDTSKFKTNHQESLNETEHHLDMTYILRKLQIICEKMTREYIIDTIENETALPTLSIDLEKDIIRDADNKLVETYLLVIELYNTQFFDVYKKVKAVITDNELNMSKFVRMTFVRLMINYCHKKYGQNKDTYLPELYDLYHFAHQNELLIEDGYMGEIDYLNLIKITVAAKDSWDEETLLNTANELKPEYRENGRLLAKATLRFKQKKYNKVQLLLLREVLWNSLEYRLDNHCLLIRTLYEVADYEQLEVELHKFDLFIDKNKTLSEIRKKPIRNFINFVRDIAHHKAANTPASEVLALNLLRQPIAYGDWCAEKLAEF